MPNGHPISDRTAITIRFAVSIGLLLCCLFVGWHDLSNRLTKIETRLDNATKDRWTATDDKIWAINFARANNLTMTTHERISTALLDD
jgi:hypothetical protein